MPQCCKVFFPPQAQGDAICVFPGGSPWALLGWYLLAVNLLTFVIFGLDKWKARRRQARPAVRRIPEKTLFVLALLGGSAGALLGMRAFHHKTLHRSFRLGIPAILILQLLIPLAVALAGRR